MTIYFDENAQSDVAKILAPVDQAPFVSLGDIFYSSWGYDQTNIDFYEVVAIKPGSLMIEIRERQKKIVRSSGSQNYVVPDSGYANAQRLKKRVRRIGDSVSVKIEDYARAYLWDGNPKGETDSMFGH